MAAAIVEGVAARARDPFAGPRTAAIFSGRMEPGPEPHVSGAAAIFGLEAKVDCAVSMSANPLISLWILILTAVTLFWVALTDLRQFRIPNELIVTLTALYFVHAIFSGAWTSMQWNIGFAFLMLLCGMYAYSLRQIGGGDLKLLAVAFLWTGPWFAAPFALLLLIFTGAYYVVAKLGFAVAKRTQAGLRIPLAPPLATALIGALALGFVTPKS